MSPGGDSFPHQNASGPRVLHDFCLQTSSIRLPLIAAGLVNSALSMLLSQVSNQLFELALIDVSSPNKTQSDNSCIPLSTTQIPDNPETAVETDVTVKSAPFNQSTESDGLGDTHCPVVSSPAVHCVPSPIHVLSIKEENGVESDVFGNHNPTETTLPLCQSSQSGANFTNYDISEEAQFGEAPRLTTLMYLKRYSCEFRGCGKVFFSRCSLLYHKQSHNPEKVHKCFQNGCNYSFASESLLQDHIQVFHTTCSRNQYRCDYPGCGKAFGYHDRLVEHIRIHTGERPYICDYPGCSYRFARRGNLFAHKRVHVDKTQRRQYHCVHPGCGKTFLYTRSLTEHMNIHMGERPYRCDFPDCDKSFTSKSYLHAHRRIHVSPSNSSFNRCEAGSFSMSTFPVTVTVPVPPGPNQTLSSFPTVSQPNDFSGYPFYPNLPG